jgi:hypothetical protein
MLSLSLFTPACATRELKQCPYPSYTISSSPSSRRHEKINICLLIDAAVTAAAAALSFFQFLLRIQQQHAEHRKRQQISMKLNFHNDDES